MKSIIKTLIITIVLLILATIFFSYIKQKSGYQDVAIVENKEHPGKKLMELHCYACHNPSTPHENRLAPPMIAVKKHYINEKTTKEEFIDDFKNWVKAPSEEISRMPGAVRKFGIMPYTPYKVEDVELIADYIFDNNIEQPEWFKEHYQKEHGKGIKKRKNKN